VLRRVIVPGLLGAVVLIAWTFVVNGVLGFSSRIHMNEIPDERRVYEVLTETIVEPGAYICNPEPEPPGRFPAGEPVFGIRYGGMGHGAAGRLALVGLAVMLLTPIVGAWMLSTASRRTLSRYGRKVLFFTGIGLLFAVYSRLTSFGIGGYPLRDGLLLAAHDIVLWTVVGLVVAWRMRPDLGAPAD